MKLSFVYRVHVHGINSIETSYIHTIINTVEYPEPFNNENANEMVQAFCDMYNDAMEREVGHNVIDSECYMTPSMFFQLGGQVGGEKVVLRDFFREFILMIWEPATQLTVSKKGNKVQWRLQI